MKPAETATNHRKMLRSNQRHSKVRQTLQCIPDYNVEVVSGCYAALRRRNEKLGIERLIV